MSVQRFKQFLTEKTQEGKFDGEFQMPMQPAVVQKAQHSAWTTEQMQSAPLMKPLSVQSRIAPAVLGLKVPDSKKRLRAEKESMQDRDDVQMDSSSEEEECEANKAKRLK